MFVSCHRHVLLILYERLSIYTTPYNYFKNSSNCTWLTEYAILKQFLNITYSVNLNCTHKYTHAITYCILMIIILDLHISTHGLDKDNASNSDTFNQFSFAECFFFMNQSNDKKQACKTHTVYLTFLNQ